MGKPVQTTAAAAAAAAVLLLLLLPQVQLLEPTVQPRWFEMFDGLN